MNKKNSYTEPQAKAIKKYLSQKAEIKLRMSPSDKERIRKEALLKGKSINSYILDAVENQIMADHDGRDIEPKLITNIISWLKLHDHNDSEIVDFISFIARQ